jgi:hypothetical protein
MGIFSKLFKKEKFKNPEEYYIVTISNASVKVEHPERKTENIKWASIEEIKLVNTDEGPISPDIWLVLLGKESMCLIPHGAEGFDEVYDIISKYPDFSFENFGKSMTCTDNAEFVLWKKKE